jgi:hypothetical protein
MWLTKNMTLYRLAVYQTSYKRGRNRTSMGPLADIFFVIRLKTTGGWRHCECPQCQVLGVVFCLGNGQS